jgi:hypothetical protein
VGRAGVGAGGYVLAILASLVSAELVKGLLEDCHSFSFFSNFCAHIHSTTFPKYNHLSPFIILHLLIDCGPCGFIIFFNELIIYLQCGWGLCDSLSTQM